MNKLYFGDNLDILREHPPRRTEGFYDKDRFGTEYHRNDRSYKLQILTIEGLMSGNERPRFPDPFDRLRASLTLGRSTFKRAAVEDMGAEQGEIIV